MTTYYEKRGRRYIPVAETEIYAGFPKGYYLVSIEPGLTSVTRTVEPDYAAVEHAMRHAMTEMVAAMHKACECRGPQMKYLSPEQKQKYLRGWEAWVREVGEDVPMYFEGVSMHDVVDAGIKALRSARTKRLVASGEL
jgi:hypothetical protein